MSYLKVMKQNIPWGPFRHPQFDKSWIFSHKKEVLAKIVEVG